MTQPFTFRSSKLGMVYSLQKNLSMFPIPQNVGRLVSHLEAESNRFEHYQR